MLVLSRKANESILIANRIKLTILQIKGGKVRLGIQAAPEIKVVRGELQQQPPSQAGAKI